MKRWMRASLMLAVVLFVAGTLAACGASDKKATTYNLYGYDSLQGKMVKQIDRYELVGGKYKYYNSFNKVVDSGRYTKYNERVAMFNEVQEIEMPTWISIKDLSINWAEMPTDGTAGTAISFKDFFISTRSSSQLASRVDNTIPLISSYYATGLGKFEGIYRTGAGTYFKLEDGKYYTSIDGSNQAASFTDEVGTYITQGDWIIRETALTGSKTIYLKTELKNEYGETVVSLINQSSAAIYSKSSKPMDTLSVSNTGHEIVKNVFTRTTNDEYTIQLRTYPTRTVVPSSEVKFTINYAMSPGIADKDDATINSSNVLKLIKEDIQLVYLDYEYKTHEGTVAIFIFEQGKLKTGDALEAVKTEFTPTAGSFGEAGVENGVTVNRLFGSATAGHLTENWSSFTTATMAVMGITNVTVGNKVTTVTQGEDFAKVSSGTLYFKEVTADTTVKVKMSLTAYVTLKDGAVEVIKLVDVEHTLKLKKVAAPE